MGDLKTAERTVETAAGPLSYFLTRKDIRNLYLRVKPGGRIEVSAGRHFRDLDVDRFVLKNELYIRKRLAAEETRAENAGVDDPDSLFYLGKKVPVIVETGQKEQVVFSPDAVRIVMRDTTDGKRREELLSRALLRHAKHLMTGMVDRFVPAFAAYSVPYPTIRFRKMTSRWGSCTPRRKTVTFNTRMIGAPVEAIEYVVVHELAHFVVADHSKRFYAVVESILPDWKARKKGLALVP